LLLILKRKKFSVKATIKILTCVMFIGKSCEAQNLIPNDNFELYSACPTNLAQIDSALYWFNPCSPPYIPVGTGSGSSDYFNACSTTNLAGVPDNTPGHQAARSGDGYAGIIVYAFGGVFREYIEIALSSLCFKYMLQYRIIC
jgi:hypothetical protein